MRIIAVFLFVGFHCITAKELTLKRGEPCTTPTNETAKCIPVKECSLILDSILTGNRGAVEFARKSQCGYDTEPLVCCGTSATLPAVLNNTNVLPNEICGWHTVDRIIGGNITQISEFPWLAALEYKGKENGASVGIRCDGTVITKRHVLTAAHCIVTDNYDIFKVWLGEHNLTTNPDCEPFEMNFCADPIKKFNIEVKIVHPHYNLASHENDIGILRLDNDIEFTDFIQPICVPGADFPALNINQHMEVSGWNLLEEDARIDTKFRSLVIPLSKKACFENTTFSGPFPENQICAVSSFRKGACWEGPGGPVMLSHHKQYDATRLYQVGVISWAVECNHLVYTQVAPYREWIIGAITKSQTVT